MRQMAAEMDRSPSTISRELKRNSSRKEGYQPVYADDLAWSRRWRGSRLDRDAQLRHIVYSCLQGGWSPQQVAGRLELEAGHSYAPDPVPRHRGQIRKTESPPTRLLSVKEQAKTEARAEV